MTCKNRARKNDAGASVSEAPASPSSAPANPYAHTLPNLENKNNPIERNWEKTPKEEVFRDEYTYRLIELG